MTDIIEHEEDNEPIGKAKGGKARAAKMTPEQRKASSKKAIEMKKHYASLPSAEYGNNGSALKVGDIEIPCYVLDDGRRVLSQGGLQTGIGMSKSGGVKGEQRIVTFLRSLESKGIKTNNLSARCAAPIEFRVVGGGRTAYGFEAEILADICDAVLEANSQGLLAPQQKHFAKQCEILVRGFARVGIVALVDEATGYQRDRERDALAKILEAFVAKEIQPYITTFPPEYYEELFRLRGLEYPPSNPKFRPQYFGLLTNDIVYKRLAPNILEELKKKTKSASNGTKLFQSLTPNIGQQKLREHLSSAVTIMKLSDDYPDFITKMNKIHPRFDDIVPQDLEDSDK